MARAILLHRQNDDKSLAPNLCINIQRLCDRSIFVRRPNRIFAYFTKSMENIEMDPIFFLFLFRKIKY